MTMKIGRDEIGQSSLHGGSLDSGSELRNPVHLENRSQPTTDKGSP